jgi:hypothetical protein
MTLRQGWGGGEVWMVESSEICVFLDSIMRNIKYDQEHDMMYYAI